MPAIAYFECMLCHRQFAGEKPQTVCPVEGGRLYVRYDMDALKRTDRRGAIGVASASSLGIWRYASVLPDVQVLSLGEGWTPMVQSRRHSGLLVKREGVNLAGSVEARGVSLAVSMAKDYGCPHLVVASAGEAAIAVAAYGAAAGLEAHVFMPKDVAFPVYAEVVLYGADAVMVPGSISDCVRAMEEKIAEQKVTSGEVWLDVSTAKGPFWMEGMKTLGYELVEQCGWRYPDAVIYPGKGETGLMGIWKGFEEMEQLGWVTGRRPKMYAVEAIPGEGPGMERLDGEVPGTICAGSGGRLVRVSEAEMRKGLADWAKQEGLLLSLEGAAATTAYEALLAGGELKTEERVVLIDTGAGWKGAEKAAEANGVRRRVVLPRSLPVGGIITPV